MCNLNTPITKERLDELIKAVAEESYQPKARRNKMEKLYTWEPAAKIADTLERAVKGSETNDFTADELKAMDSAIRLLRNICELNVSVETSENNSMAYLETAIENSMAEYFKEQLPAIGVRTVGQPCDYKNTIKGGMKSLVLKREVFD